MSQGHRVEVEVFAGEHQCVLCISFVGGPHSREGQSCSGVMSYLLNVLVISELNLPCNAIICPVAARYDIESSH